MPANTDILILIIRLLLGTFFILARFRWFWDPSRTPLCWFNPSRREHLTQKLCSCGYGVHPILAGLVAFIEVSAGLGLVVGLLTRLSAFGLAVITGFATYCTAREKVLAQNPVDKVDCVSCYLWRVEGPYLALELALILTGGGLLSLDHFLGLPL